MVGPNIEHEIINFNKSKFHVFILKQWLLAMFQHCLKIFYYGNEAEVDMIEMGAG